VNIPLIDIRKLAELMPMHLTVDRGGAILSRGRTLARVLGNAARLDEAFVFSSSTGQRICFDGLLSQLDGGKRIFLQMRHHRDVVLRGHGVHVSSDLAVLSLGFGICLSPAVQEFALTDSDFAPSDLAMEFLFLHEANRAAMQELSRVNTHLEEARENAQILSITDPLTGLLNRRGFEAEFAKAFAQRARTPFALVHLDLDRFKEINDRFGHAAGDRALVEVASVLASEVRSGDRACRMGGDEFLMLVFTRRPQADARQVCKRIIQRIESLAICPDCAGLSASVGVAVSDAALRPDHHQLFEMADAALYRAKALGRGRVILWEEGAC